MEPINPYQPPQGDTLEDVASKKQADRPVYDTRWQAVRAGIRRGAASGMILVTVVFGLLVGGIIVSYYFGWLPRRTFPESWLFFCFQAVFIIFGGGFFYGAIPGGLIMVLTEMVRFQEPNRAPQTNTSEKKAERRVFDTRWQATWAGVRRGPILGMVIATIVSVISIVGTLLAIIFLLLMKPEHILSSAYNFFIFVIQMPALIGVLLAVWVVSAIECTILAGVLMGLIETIRFRKPQVGCVRDAPDV